MTKEEAERRAARFVNVSRVDSAGETWWELTNRNDHTRFEDEDAAYEARDEQRVKATSDLMAGRL